MEDEAKNMGALRQEEAAALMRQLRSVQENVSSLRVMIESRGTGEVSAPWYFAQRQRVFA
jgi:hypothetical protein